MFPFSWESYFFPLIVRSFMIWTILFIVALTWGKSLFVTWGSTFILAVNGMRLCRRELIFLAFVFFLRLIVHSLLITIFSSLLKLHSPNEKLGKETSKKSFQIIPDPLFFSIQKNHYMTIYICICCIYLLKLTLSRLCLCLVSPILN